MLSILYRRIPWVPMQSCKTISLYNSLADGKSISASHASKDASTFENSSDAAEAPFFFKTLTKLSTSAAKALYFYTDQIQSNRKESVSLDYTGHTIARDVNSAYRHVCLPLLKEESLAQQYCFSERHLTRDIQQSSCLSNFHLPRLKNTPWQVWIHQP